MPPEPAPEFEYLCEVCQAGHVHARTATLVEWVGGEFITVPNFPIWICDVCGAREYDSAALEQLQAVLGPRAALRRRSGTPPGAGGRPSLPRTPGRRSG